MFEVIIPLIILILPAIASGWIAWRWKNFTRFFRAVGIFFPICLACLAFLIGVFKGVFLEPESPPKKTLPFSEFISAVRAGHVDKVEIHLSEETAEYVCEMKPNNRGTAVLVSTQGPSTYKIADELDRNGVMYRYVEAKEQSPWRYALLGVVSVTFFNVILVIVGIWLPWVRRVLLHPIGSQVIGLVLGKYFVINFLLHFVKPVRLAWFRHYRKRAVGSSLLGEWDKTVYASPVLTFEHDLTIDDGPKPLYQKLFRSIVTERYGDVWLVKGRSGLGKTALLEQWTRDAFLLGQTPLLIRLGTDLTAAAEAAALMHQYGELAVEASTAEDLLRAGGFVVLLDGLNEDRNPGSTREFIRHICQKNTVIVSSQFDPQWPNDIKTRTISLEPFGAEQLRTFLNDYWIEELQKRPALFEECRLPQLAVLLGDYLIEHGHLPDLRLNLYENLLDNFLQSAERSGLLDQANNLSVIAWQLFILNRSDFQSDEAFPEQLCREAKGAKLLTIVEGKYRFRHERIQRYMVARYLRGRLDSQPFTIEQMAELHREVNNSLSRQYWVEVFDFLAEMYARDTTDAYSTTILEMGRFEPIIFRDRLFPQIRRLQTQGLIKPSQAFYEAAADILSGNMRK